MQRLALPAGPTIVRCKPSTSPYCSVHLHGPHPARQRVTSATGARLLTEVQLGWSRRRVLCSAEGSSSGGTSTTADKDEKIKSTLADLDAILGIQEEPAEKKDEEASGGTLDATGMDLLQSAVAAEVQKMANKEGIKNPEMETMITDQMKKILERAKLMADEQNKEDVSAGQKQMLQQEFEQLLNIFFASESSMSKADIKKLRDSGVFGPLSFWVTEIKNLEEEGPQPGVKLGVLIRGNLRTDRTKVFENLCEKVKELFGDKYGVLMIEDPEAFDPEGGPISSSSSSSAAGSSAGVNGNSSGGAGGAAAAVAEPRVAFQIVPSSALVPPPTSGWKVAVAGVLLLLLLLACGQLSLVANISKLPKETLEWFSNPDNVNSDLLPPGLDTWDPVPYLSSAIPIFFSLLGVNFMHEVGHRIAAYVRGVKLGPTYFIPNLQIGSFGAITPIASLLKNRAQLWDVAAAGPVAGVTFSLALLAIGLSQSDPGALPKELLVPVPTALFQGSLLLGSITRFALGPEALAKGEVLISPLAIAGWCGLITNALNLLPVGSLDGGRMVQAAYGTQALSLSSFFTYVGLGLGLLGSSLSLPFGLYVLICQRTAERYIQDSVSPISSPQRTATLVAVLTAVLILVPMAPELAQEVGVGAANPNLFM